MLGEIKNFINTHGLFTASDKLLLASSGGKDSMALAYYLKENGYRFAVAHCNFMLRGPESDADQQFIESFCIQHQLTFLTVNFDTQDYSKKNKISIQEAARILRYEWLEKMRVESESSYVLTAHHLNDNIETLIFNLSKGTGIKGIRGMLPKNGHIVRPMLEINVEEIWDYIQLNSIQFREDSSNSLTKYDRNKIRHEVIPVLEEINPNLSKSLLAHFERWRDIEKMHSLVLSEWQRKLFQFKGADILIPIAKLKAFEFNKSLLYELLYPYHFNNADVEDLLQSFAHKETKVFLSTSHRLIKDRKFLVLSSLDSLGKSDSLVISQNLKKLSFGNGQLIRLHLKPKNNLSRISEDMHYAYADYAKLTFPLVLRKWETGDYFYPIGLQKASGKASKKKLSKFLRDEKLSTYDKENVWVLCSGEKIVWVVGRRLDDRFKIKESSENILEIHLT